jgi:hypothetical protein
LPKLLKQRKATVWLPGRRHCSGEFTSPWRREAAATNGRALHSQGSVRRRWFFGGFASQHVF